MDNMFNDSVFKENIRRIRKEKGMTQEQLADAVGVSAQAVSKWEIGSFPDAGLLPVVADALGVKIDELFGRGDKELTMNQQVTKYIYGLPEEDKLKAAGEICRALLLGSVGSYEYIPVPEQSRQSEWDCHGQIELESGWMQQRYNDNLQYFFLMPEPKEGYDTVLKYDERQVEFFRFLSSPDALRAMYYLGEGDGYRFFNKEALMCELHITGERAEEIIEDMLNLNLVVKAKLQEGKGEENIYQYRVRGNFITFMIGVRTILNLPYNYHYQANKRESAYLKNHTYKDVNKTEKNCSDN